MAIWTNSAGALLVNSRGQPLTCDNCPCEKPGVPCGGCTETPLRVQVTLPNLPFNPTLPGPTTLICEQNSDGFSFNGNSYPANPCQWYYEIGTGPNDLLDLRVQSETVIIAIGEYIWSTLSGDCDWSSLSVPCGAGPSGTGPAIITSLFE